MGIEFFHLTTTAMLCGLATGASPVIIAKTEHVQSEISHEARLNKRSRDSWIAGVQASLLVSIMKRIQLQIARAYIYICHLITMAIQHAFAGCNKKLIRSSWF